MKQINYRRYTRLLPGMIVFLLWASREQILICDAAAYELHITCPPENFLELRTLPFYPPTMASMLTGGTSSVREIPPRRRICRCI